MYYCISKRGEFSIKNNNNNKKTCPVLISVKIVMDTRHLTNL